MTGSTDAEAGRKPYDLTSAGYDFPPREGAPLRTVLICTHPRSGSTLLGEAVHFAGGLGSPLEYFHVGFRPALAARWGTESARDYAGAVWRHRTDPGGTLAVKLFWRDVHELAAELGHPGAVAFGENPPESFAPDQYRALWEALAPVFPAAEFVHLMRRDALRQAISGAVATRTQVWRSIPGIENAPLAEPEFDMERIESLIAYSNFCHGHWRNLFAAIHAAPLALSYEELTADYDGTVRRLLAHLGSSAAPPPPRMQRQADGRSEALVLRYLRERATRPAA